MRMNYAHSEGTLSAHTRSNFTSQGMRAPHPAAKDSGKEKLVSRGPLAKVRTTADNSIHCFARGDPIGERNP